MCQADLYLMEKISEKRIDNCLSNKGTIVGYYTEFSLRVQSENQEEIPHLDMSNIIDDFRNSDEWALDAIDEDGYSYESCKWYEHGDDIKKFSLKYPDKLFVLDCKGEDGKSWVWYALNGKAQKCDAVITIPPYDKNKLV